MRRPWIVIACAALIVTLAMGVRQAFGLFMPQMSGSLGKRPENKGHANPNSKNVIGQAHPNLGANTHPQCPRRVVAAGTQL